MSIRIYYIFDTEFVADLTTCVKFPRNKKDQYVLLGVFDAIQMAWMIFKIGVRA